MRANPEWEVREGWLCKSVTHYMSAERGNQASRPHSSSRDGWCVVHGAEAFSHGRCGDRYAIRFHVLAPKPKPRPFVVAVTGSLGNDNVTRSGRPASGSPDSRPPTC